MKGIKLLFAGEEHYPDTFNYSSRIWYYGDLPSYFVVRVAAFFDLFTYHTYSATACLFALLSFSGLWALYITFYRIYPQLHFQLAIAVLFVPSVFFWGSGIMKDTLTLTGLAWATYAIIQLFFEKKNYLVNGILLLLSLYSIYSIKIYILLCFIPAAVTWIFFSGLKSIRSRLIRALLYPITIALVVGVSYLAILKIAQEHEKYELSKLSVTAEITARWLTFVSTQEGGSGYVLGDFDYSPAGMVRKLPLAINVSLFRPYIWEVNNPVMLFAALESLFFFLTTIYIFVKSGPVLIIRTLKDNPFIAFCLLFSLSFAFAVGFSTYNFGSLVRYKIPLLPYYLSALFIIKYYSNKLRKLALLASKE